MVPEQLGASMELNGLKDKGEDARSAETEAARRIARRFDSQGRRALGEIVESLKGDGGEARILQQLNRLDRHDIVRAIAEHVGVDGKKGESFAVEAARAYLRSGERVRAAGILAGHVSARRRDYAFQYAAGRVYSEMRLYAEALSCFKAALAAKPTQLAAERVFAAHLALEQYEEAAAAAGRVVRAGNLRPAMVRDLAYLLKHLPPGRLDPDLADALSALEGNEETLVPALMPHLIEAGRIESVRAAVRRGLAAAQAWNHETLEILVPCLARNGEFELLLRLQDQTPAADGANLFSQALAAAPKERIAECALPQLEGLPLSAASQAGPCALLARIPALLTPALYAREKHRIARLAANALADDRARATHILAQLVSRLLTEETRAFYSGSAGSDLAAALREARREAAAPQGSRLARLRDDYFAFWFERRRAVPAGAIGNDVVFCDTALDYFSDLSDHRPAIQVPLGRVAADRLSQTSLMLDNGIVLDKLGAWALIHARPQISLKEPERFWDFLWWYLEGVVVRRALPPAAIAPGIMAYLNHVLLADNRGGVSLSRFLRSAWSRNPDDRRHFDLGNPIDRVLFGLEFGARTLDRANECLPFFEPLLSAPLVSASLRTFGATDLADALESVAPAGTAARAQSDVQDVLLLGHGGRETGLGRNFGMLARGLTAEGIALTTLDFDAGGDVVSGTAERWYRERRSDAVVVLAVNAQDAPDAFVKDRTNTIAECHVAGFFLWEMTAVPEVQKLGVELVDEIWAPTRYVADIYAPYKPAYVVGKGLFAGDEDFLGAPIKQAANPMFRFVTAFDFDSSIERKNPLAVVLAFQRAFTKNERVELVVKTSNVDPRHWSNAWGQWERLTAAAKSDRRIRLIASRYTNEQMAALLRDADCVVSLHRSEGFGYLMTDAMAFGIPVIASGYSGNADFCDAETAYPVDCRLVDVPEGAARWRCFGARWGDPDIAMAAAQMQAVLAGYPAALGKAARARARIVERYSLNAFRKTLVARIGAIRALPAKPGSV